MCVGGLFDGRKPASQRASICTLEEIEFHGLAHLGEERADLGFDGLGKAIGHGTLLEHIKLLIDLVGSEFEGLQAVPLLRRDTILARDLSPNRPQVGNDVIQVSVALELIAATTDRGARTYPPPLPSLTQSGTVSARLPNSLTADTQSGIKSVVPSNVIRSAGGGARLIAGRFTASLIGGEPGPLGTVRTTWLGGSGVPFFR